MHDYAKFSHSMRNAQKEYKLQDREQGCEESISHLCEAEKNEFCKPCETEENEFRNPLRNFRKPCETKAEENQFHTLYKIFTSIAKSSCVIFRYFCTDSIRFLSQDILCNYLFSPYNQIKIFLDI